MGNAGRRLSWTFARIILLAGVTVGVRLLLPLHRPAETPSDARIRSNELPLGFEVDPCAHSGAARFRAAGAKPWLTLAPERATLRLSGGRAALGIQFLGADANARGEGERPLPGRSHYYVGKDPTKWRLNVARYSRIHYRDVYPGIDIVYYGNQRQLEFDLLLAPGAREETIALDFPGATGIALSQAGDLVLDVDGTELIQSAPRVYQDVGGKRLTVAARYVFRGDRRIGIELASYDRQRPLVIDPTLTYATFLRDASANYEVAQSIAIDSAGNAYLAGTTTNVPGTNPLPTTSGAFDTTYNGIPDPFCGGALDAFFVKLDPTGSTELYGTYLGGSLYDTATSIAIDGAGNVILAGQTDSLDFPVFSAVGTPFNPTPPPSWPPPQEAFLSIFNSAGNLIYSTYLGPAGTTLPATVNGVAADAAGNVYLTGASSTGFPTTAGSISTVAGGGIDAYVAKLAPLGGGATDLVYSTFLGGPPAAPCPIRTGFCARSNGTAIAIDGAGDLYVAGQTCSPNFPITLGAFQSTRASTSLTPGVCNDAFLAKIHPAGGGMSDLVYSTYLGGAGSDFALGVAIDASGKAYLTGSTFSTDFPTTASALQRSLGTSNDAFVAKIDPAASGAGGLVYSTLLGGNNEDMGFGIAVDGYGSAYVVGRADSTDFPLVNALPGAGPSGFVAKLNANASALLFSTVFPGAFWMESIAVNAAGDAYATVRATSSFSTTAGAFIPACTTATCGPNIVPAVVRIATGDVGGTNDSDGDGDPDIVDCAPFNSAINSAASEVCDGVDNNCNGFIDDRTLVQIINGSGPTVLPISICATTDTTLSLTDVNLRTMAVTIPVGMPGPIAITLAPSGAVIASILVQGGPVPAGSAKKFTINGVVSTAMLSLCVDDSATAQVHTGTCAAPAVAVPQPSDPLCFCKQYSTGCFCTTVSSCDSPPTTPPIGSNCGAPGGDFGCPNGTYYFNGACVYGPPPPNPTCTALAAVGVDRSICRECSGGFCRVTFGGSQHTFVGENLDADADGVPNCLDRCPNTTNLAGSIPVSGQLLPGHLGDRDLILGCNAADILSCKPGQSIGERKWGITPGTANVFESIDTPNPIAWAADCAVKYPPPGPCP